jgi:acid phosphatase
MMHRWRLAVLPLAVIASAAAPRSQEARPAHFELGGEVLAAPSAEFDVFGSLRATGTAKSGAPRMLMLRFAELEPPPPGEHAFGGEAPVSLQLDGAARAGKLTVEALGAGRAALRGALDAAGDAAALVFRIDLVPSIPAAVVAGARPGTTTPPPVREPDREDLVFAALGNTGTGGDAQRRVGRALAGLAATGPLDLVLLCGDVVLPGGARTVDDPAWRRCFEEPYPDVQLPVPFYAVLGDRDHRGTTAAYVDYSRANARLQYPQFTYDFTVQSHGVEVLFIGIDTTLFAEGPKSPAMRSMNRLVGNRLGSSKAAVKIVFGHHTIHGHGEPPGPGDASARRALEEYALPVFVEQGLDLYVASGEHHLELVEHDKGLLEVVTGTAGGLTRSARWDDRTRFASTAPGFAWFRFDGKTIELSFRGADGEVLHVQRWQPRSR